MSKKVVTVHAHALVDEGATIGAGTRIWAFAHILSGANIGEDCNICDHTFIENKVILGDRVTVKCGVYLWDGVVVEDGVFIGPNATFTNDVRPRSRKHPESYPETRLKKGCSIGANATILPGLKIGMASMVGAGSVVTRDVPDYSIVYGNPARIMGWICSCGNNIFAENQQQETCSCGRRYTRKDETTVIEADIQQGKE